MPSSSAAVISSTTTASPTTAPLSTVISLSTTPSSAATPLKTTTTTTTTTTASSASSSAVPNSSDKEKTNHVRLSRLLADIGRRVLQDVLDSLHPPSRLHAFLNSGLVYSQLVKLKSKKIIQSEQWDKLYPPAGVTVSSGNFDITLLFLLLRNVCGGTTPSRGWDAAPLATDLSMEADLVRIKRCRNELYAHRVEMAMTDKEFNSNWMEIEAALVRLGGDKYKPDIQHLKTEYSTDREKEKYFQTLLSQAWEEIEDTVRWKDLTQRDYIILVGVIAIVSPVVAHHLTNVLSQGFVILTALVILSAVLYQLYMPGSWYRYRECNKGRIEGSEVWFTFTTFSKQTPRVHGVEFEWETLKKKLNLPFDKHKDPGMRYYLNIDRCAYGGVVLVKSSLPWDRTPQVCGAEIFAVDSTCSHAYYEMEGKWHVYVSGRDFKSIQPYN